MQPFIFSRWHFHTLIMRQLVNCAKYISTSVLTKTENRRVATDVYFFLVLYARMLFNLLCFRYTVTLFFY